MHKLAENYKIQTSGLDITDPPNLTVFDLYADYTRKRISLSTYVLQMEVTSVL